MPGSGVSEAQGLAWIRGAALRRHCYAVPSSLAMSEPWSWPTVWVGEGGSLLNPQSSLCYRPAVKARPLSLPSRLSYSHTNGL